MSLRSQTTYTSRFAVGDSVSIDGSRDIKATVTAVCFRSNNYTTLSCEYFHNGDAKSAWIEEWRTEPWEV